MNTLLKYIALSIALGAFLAPVSAAEGLPWWWDDAWWTQGQLEVPANHKVKTEWSNVINGDIDIPVMIVRPDDNKKYPAVLFQHGRRGLDDLIQLHVKRLAAQGFVVVAADVFNGRFIEKYPIEHDYEVEGDVNKALDFLMARKDISSKQACVYSHTRGGYMSLKVAVKYKRQDNDLACYVSYYPHMQDPNAPEAMQVYRYAIEADDLKIPTLIFIGEDEQYQRRRPIEMAVASLQEKKRPARLIIYPGVGRGFDFRPDAVRSFADDLAAKDAIQRASKFMKQNLK
ncbi:MAG: dienelactone hydrolase [Gammaproteobacteria bacterium]|nr:dienelactone hydrolase [Gammaproteobacteria bacterium]